MIHRFLQDKVESKLNKGKAIMITGPRQVGKTTLLGAIQTKYKDTLYLTGDDAGTKDFFENPSASNFQAEFKKTKILLLDEAQRIKNIGLALKIITDRIKSLQLVVTGSSAFELAEEIKEPLTGRVFEYTMLPVSCAELVAQSGRLKEKEHLERRLVYGSYPEICNNPGEELEILRNLSGSYLYKDIFSFQQLRNPELLDKLLKALALQLGSEVSFQELAQTCGADIASIQKYIRLLELSFVIYRLPGFSRNIRNELKRSRKIYFYDNGIRNAIIGNFNAAKNRTDIGALWENYILSERYKNLMLQSGITHRYFWRTTQQQEIDYLEETNGALQPVEIKWNPATKAKLTATFTNNYQSAPLKIVNRENYLDYLC